MHRVLAALLTAGVSAMGVGSSPAQSTQVQPPSDHGSIQVASATASSTSPRTGALLRRLPPLSTGSRLSGEQASILAPVYVTRKQADARARFRLGTLSSVSVLPESGTLAVSLNGVNVGAVPVGAAYGLRVTEFDIPAGSLHPGWNSVGIAAQHRHRVDCSVDAADELWTRIDPAETGLMFADGTVGPPDLADIAAIGPRPDGAVPIGIALDSERLLKPQTVERLGRAVQGVALAGRFTQPVVEFETSGEDGLDLVLGTVTDVAARIDRTGIGEITGPTIAVVPGVGNRRPMIVVTGRSDAELDDAIAELGTIAPSGSGPGLNALEGASGHRISPDGQSLALGDMASKGRSCSAARCAWASMRRCRTIFWPPITAGRRSIWPICGRFGCRRPNHCRGEWAQCGKCPAQLHEWREFQAQATFPAAQCLPARAEPDRIAGECP